VRRAAVPWSSRAAAPRWTLAKARGTIDIDRDKVHLERDGFMDYALDGFNRNSLIYAAIMYKVFAQMNAPLRAMVDTAQGVEVAPLDHPLAQLLNRPNLFQSGAEFENQNTVYKNLAGQTFVLLVRPPRGGFPLALYSLRPDRVWIIPQDIRRIAADWNIKGYWYVPVGKSLRDGLPVLPQDMMHIRLPNPADSLMGMGYGMAPLSPMARTGDVDNEITEFLKQFFEHGTQLGGIVSFNVDIDDDAAARIEERWQQVYGGHQHWGKVIAAGGGAQFQPLSMSFRELGFAELDERNESRILMPFGVHPILLGTRLGLERSTLTNYPTARTSFWEDRFVPELQLSEVEYQYYLRTKDGAYPAYDLSTVPALQKNISELVDAARAMCEMGYNKETATATVGLQVHEVTPGADVAEEEDALQADNDDRDKRAGQGGTIPMWLKDDRRRLWYKLDGQARAWETEFGDAANAAFEHDKRSLLAILQTHKSRNLELKQSVDWEAISQDWREYLDTQSPTFWQDTFAPLIAGLITETATEWAAELGISFEVINPLALEAFEDYLVRFAQPIDETTNTAIVAMLQQATFEGWSIDQMANRLETLFEQWKSGNVDAAEFEWFAERAPFWRREMIARTETMRALNFGSFAQFRDWGFLRKEWLTQMDGRQRESHGDAVGQIKPIDEPFIINGYEMMYPLDGSRGASAKEIVNCRCAVLPA